MTTQYFTFSVRYANKTIAADCYVYTTKEATSFPYTYPLYRVALNPHARNPKVYLFHEVNRPGQRFFYFQTEGLDIPLMEAIKKALEQWNGREQTTNG